MPSLSTKERKAIKEFNDNLLNVVKIQDRMALQTGFVNVFLSLKFYLQHKKVLGLTKNHQPICYQ